MRWIFILALLIPLTGKSQKVEYIRTSSTFANLGDYNPENNSVLFLAFDVDQSKEKLELSLRVKNVSTGKETILQQNLSREALGWLDASHVLIDSLRAISGPKSFLEWRGFLVRYDIYTHKRDTLTSSWYNSKNHVKDFLTSSNKIFYTIAYGAEDMKIRYWVEYSVNNGSSRIIKSFAIRSFSILTYQYIDNLDEIIYVKSKGEKKEIVRLSIASGSEATIQTIPEADAIIDTSTIIGQRFFYVCTRVPMSSRGVPDWRNAHYYIKAVDLKTGKITDVYNSKEEITKISRYKESQILVSVHGGGKTGTVDKRVEIPAGGEITLGLDAASYLCVFTPRQ
jgi:hypothetical protein